jgi:hypothetical protein
MMSWFEVHMIYILIKPCNNYDVILHKTIWFFNIKHEHSHVQNSWNDKHVISTILHVKTLIIYLFFTHLIKNEINQHIFQRVLNLIHALNWT